LVVISRRIREPFRANKRSIKGSILSRQNTSTSTSCPLLLPSMIRPQNSKLRNYLDIPKPLLPSFYPAQIHGQLFRLQIDDSGIPLSKDATIQTLGTRNRALDGAKPVSQEIIPSDLCISSSPLAFNLRSIPYLFPIYLYLLIPLRFRITDTFSRSLRSQSSIGTQ